MFVKNLEASYKKHLADERAKKKAPEGGHQLASEDDDDEDEDEDGEPTPDMDKVWADFAERLRQGEIKADEKGQLVYEVAGPPREQTWWEKYQTHIMLSVNVMILWFMQHVRRRERELRKEEKEQNAQQQGSERTKKGRAA